MSCTIDLYWEVMCCIIVMMHVWGSATKIFIFPILTPLPGENMAPNSVVVVDYLNPQIQGAYNKYQNARQLRIFCK